MTRSLISSVLVLTLVSFPLFSPSPARAEGPKTIDVIDAGDYYDKYGDQAIQNLVYEVRRRIRSLNYSENETIEGFDRSWAISSALMVAYVISFSPVAKAYVPATWLKYIRPGIVIGATGESVESVWRLARKHRIDYPGFSVVNLHRGDSIWLSEQVYDLTLKDELSRLATLDFDPASQGVRELKDLLGKHADIAGNADMIRACDEFLSFASEASYREFLRMLTEQRPYERKNAVFSSWYLASLQTLRSAQNFDSYKNQLGSLLGMFHPADDRSATQIMKTAQQNLEAIQSLTRPSNYVGLTNFAILDFQRDTTANLLASLELSKELKRIHRMVDGVLTPEEILEEVARIRSDIKTHSGGGSPALQFLSSALDTIATKITSDRFDDRLQKLLWIYPPYMIQ
jgi:hypothetical protein